MNFSTSRQTASGALAYPAKIAYFRAGITGNLGHTVIICCAPWFWCITSLAILGLILTTKHRVLLGRS